jgi:hypothetical protein
MKRTLWLLILLASIGCASAQTTVSFNFSLGAQSVSGWINVTGDPSVAVRTGVDPASGISISSIAIANWHPSDAAAADGYGASGGTFFPAAVMLDHWYQYGGSVSVYNASAPQLLISGLRTDSVYTLRMTGSSTTTSNSNPTTYTVSGLSVATPIANNSHNNTANGAVFTNIAPDANGMIRVYVNTLTTTDVADICGIQIISTGPSSSSGTGGGNWKVNGTTVYDSVDNIAIGTNNPQGYRLAVNGKAIFTKVVVKPSGSWPDYVFRKDFHLPSLPELEHYIREHQHLPGVASEKEVNTGGIDVSEHEAALLRKVEELTLYLIEQGKRLDAQQKEIDALKARIGRNTKHH